ncbi:type II toxin-antitoxin system VapC family toxin [Streptomonospora algeriensis]|uniref:Type II toxin-antitoxin system VapC family toxin n=1 Tax=Streptomonospora algeriensis TaxID=995084 RepID=A0ABW3BH72_9ACTN
MLLLDSQTALWVLDDNKRLGARSRTLISEADRVHVSAATVWELTIKAMLGKITVPDRLSERIEQQGLTLLSIKASDAEAIRDCPEPVRHDPFDRLIAAQAEQAGMRLLTSDAVLLGLGRPLILDSRD